MSLVGAKLRLAPRVRVESMPGGERWESSFTKPGLATRRLRRRRSVNAMRRDRARRSARAHARARSAAARERAA